MERSNRSSLHHSIRHQNITHTTLFVLTAGMVGIRCPRALAISLHVKEHSEVLGRLQDFRISGVVWTTRNEV